MRTRDLETGRYHKAALSLATVAHRFWGKVHKPEGCWLWTGTILDGYGYISIERRLRRAHRVSWELSGRTLDPALTLDHLCRNRACVNPDHLEQVPIRENLLRGASLAAQNARKTHCPAGHPLFENVRDRAGGRYCRICRRDQTRAYRAARKAVA